MPGPARWIAPPKALELEWSAEGVTATLHGQVVGTPSYIYAENLALMNTSDVIATTHGFIYRRKANLQQVAYDQWTIDFEYGRKNEVGEYTWDFDTSGGTVTITQAKESIKRYYSGGSVDGSSSDVTNIPKHFGAIGVEKDEVKGTEIVIPAMKINVQFRHPQAFVTMDWAKTLSDITGKVNSTAFLKWAAGEVLFLGARGSDGSEAEATIAYQFAMSKNVTGLSIGSIASVAKKGWEYLWIKYKDEPSGGRPSKPPEFVYVERVYDTSDFKTVLGFG